MDVSEPPRIVFEGTASCAEGQHAETELREALSRASAPAAGWLVAARLHKTAANLVQADGDITDERGAALGHRVFTGKPGDCDALARAVGVWASLVLDAEVRRPRTAAAANDEPAAAAKVDAGVPQPSPIASANDALPDPWPPPDETSSRRDDPATFEIGIGTFVMSGIGGGSALVGGTPFLVIAATKSFFFRPAIALGESLEGRDSTWAAVRLEGCFRVVGQYASRRGLQMDMCGGVDVGVISVLGLDLAYVAPGPSLDLGGELASDFSVILRGIGGVNATPDNRVDTPLFSFRGELDLSWRLQ